jgi:hypothetical protein
MVLQCNNSYSEAEFIGSKYFVSGCGRGVLGKIFETHYRIRLLVPHFVKSSLGKAFGKLYRPNQERQTRTIWQHF